MRRSCVAFIAGIVLTLLISRPQALAVKAQFWTHDQPAPFTKGELEQIVVSDHGEVMLGREQKILFVGAEDVEVVNALARAGDGKVYAATGPAGVIYQVDGETVTEFARLPDETSIFSLVFHKNGQLLAGTGGGEQARIYMIDGNGNASLFHEPDEASYIWALVRGREGEIYAATGVEGQLLVIDADGDNSRVLADLDVKNLLCLVYGTDGMLYGGTDEEGLIYRINPSSGSLYVMYDAKEAEISALAVDDHGNIFAGTADASAARPGRTIADRPGGKPDNAEDNNNGSTTQPATSNADESSDADNGDDIKAKRQAAMRAMIAKRLGRAVTGNSTPSADGNAIYRIDRDGFVSEIFREPVMILGLAESQGTLFASTGNEGRVYAIEPADEKTIMLAKLEPQQATALLRAPDGNLIIGTANDARVVRLSKQFASKGTLVSEPLDAGQIVKWGRLVWKAKVPEGTQLTVATRSSNVENTEANAWEDWSAEITAAAPQQIASAGARFLQYRLTFESTVPDATPALREVKIAYIEENRAPEIGKLNVISLLDAATQPSTPAKVKGLAGRRQAMAKASDEPDPAHVWVAIFDANDPNQDTLTYEVYFRELGHQRWIRMAKDLDDNFQVWDTRTVPDGRYELRVTASDRKSNAPGSALSDVRISDAVVVDNTPPDATVGVVSGEGGSRITVNASFHDTGSNVAGAAYTIDSDETWIPLAALDDIFDSPNETVSFTIDDLEPGDHRVALRVYDAQGNVRYVTQYANLAD